MPFKQNDQEINKRINEAWDRAKTTIFEEKFIPWKFHKRGDKFEPKSKTGREIKKVEIRQTKAESSDAPKYGEFDESYNLTIPLNSDTAYITAPSSYGILHALTSMTQLFYYSKNFHGAVYNQHGPIAIIDKPKFQHRGLNLDVARQWYPKEDILRTIDALAWNKMNRLHLHVTDSQSWPIEIPALPKLAERGAYADGLTYSPDDIKMILKFAEKRGVQVIVEIDMPGHTSVIHEAYPELITGWNIQPDWATYAAQPPSGSLKLKNPAVKRFLSTLLGDLLPRLRDHSPYFHTGGDEVNKNVYLLDEGIKSSDPKVLTPALQDFVSHVHGEVKNNKMSPVVWEEMLLDWNLTMSTDTIVQTWLSDESTRNVVNRGHRAIAGNYNFWYLDCGNGQWLDFGPNVAQQFYPYNDYCAPKKNWRLSMFSPPLLCISKNTNTNMISGNSLQL